MKTLLICPSARAGVPLLSASMPLCTYPLLGHSVLEYWLSGLASSGVNEVLVLAHDRPEQVQAVVGDGARWGLTVRVIAESRELTPPQASIKYAQELDPLKAQGSIALLDHFPGQEQYPLFDSYSAMFIAMREWLPNAMVPDRVGYRELQPGVWVSTYANVSVGAKLIGPCWIGHYSSVAAGALIGPNSIVEDEVLVGPNAQVANSCIAGRTYVGSLARINDSIAFGGTLVNWQTGSTVEVPDPFLLCALRQPRRIRNGNWFARVAELISRGKEEPSELWKHLVLNKES